MERTIGGGRPRRTAPGWQWLLAAVFAIVLTGCGGSGSSGFDGIAAENAAIDDALESGGCVTERGLTICASTEVVTPVPVPSATSTPPLQASATRTATRAFPTTTGTAPADETATPTTTMAFPTTTGTRPADSTPTPTTMPLPSATATAEQIQTPTVTRTTTGSSRTATPSWTPTATQVARPNVDIQLDPTDIANCAGSADAQCGLRLAFVPIAAPASAAYRAAVRTRDPDSDWRILEVTGNAVDIVIGPDVDVIQLAILLYERDPGPVPTQVKILFDSGADYAFVSAPVTLRDAAP